MAHVVLPESESGRESYAAILHRGEEGIVPWAGMGSCVSDDIDPAANCGENVTGTVWMNEDGFTSAMSLVRGSLKGALWKRGAAGRRGEKLYAVDAFIEKLPGSGSSLRRVGYFWSGKFHKAHEAENLI